MPGDPWFVPKESGKGFAPATWQGWLITFGAVVLFLATVFVAIARIAMTGQR